MKNKSLPRLQGIVLPAFAFILLSLFLIHCSPPAPQQDLVAQVIHSMASDSLPLVAMPENADPEATDWKGIDLEPKSPVLPLYPEEEAKRFLLPPGYKIEPVLTEPQIQQPAAIAFDGDGNMFVLELRTYMLTADSEGTLEPESRISRWQDKDQDGVYETGTAFVDHLIFPRFVLPYGKNCILTMESDADNVYKYTDTDGDGVADKKEFFTNKYGRSGNVEHQQAFMYWGMDNWLYSTVNAFRVRETPGGVLREKTGFNRAQWGVAHDDDGKLWFQGGASGLPSYFQFPIHYGNIEVKDQFAAGFEIPWGAPVKIGDMQGGMDEIRQPDGSLNRVTGSAGNDVFRGHRLPKDLVGQYFYGEPVARIVRQINPVVEEGLTILHNVYQDQQSEFIRSTDPLFRPVDMATAPDGTMYIVDMYHGIIQEGQWAQKGSYLRTKIEQYQLDKVVGLGRIWRVTYEGLERDNTKPAMFSKTPAQLVKYLEHPNGWWRDKAQQLIVLSKDASVKPALVSMAKKHPQMTSRFHAIWSLEGLNALDADLVQTLLKDEAPRIRIQALRAGESTFKAGQKQLAQDFLALIQDADTDVAIQAMLSAKYLQLPGYEKEIRELLAKATAKGIQLVGEQVLNPPVIRGFGVNSGPELAAAQTEMLEKGATIFHELCSQCHGNEGNGTPVGQGLIMAPPLAGSTRVQGHPDYVIKTVMHGMTGPIEGKTFPGGVMVGMKEQSDEWIASISSFIRMNFTNEASFVSAEEVKKVRESTANRTTPYTYEELMTEVPQILVLQKDWKVTASHSASARIGGTASPLSAFNFEGWTTGENQAKGMWFQIELPKMTTISEIHFVSPPIRRGWRPDAPPPIHTYPRSYEIRVSLDGQNWDNTIASGQCDDPENHISFYPVDAKYLRISQTADVQPEGDIMVPWSMKELKIYGIEAKPLN